MGIRSKIKAAFLLIAILGLLVSCKKIEFKEKDVFPGAGKSPVSLEKMQLSFTRLNTESLETWTYSPESPRLMLVFFPGNGGLTAAHSSFLRDFADRYHAKAVTINYRGYGRSSGKASIEAISEDSTEFIRLLSQEESNRGLPIIIMSHSLGGFAAASCAGLPQVSGYFIISTFTSSAELAGYWRKKLVPWYARPFVTIEAAPEVFALDNISRIKGLTAPVIFAHGTKDDVIPYVMSKELYSACPSANKKLIIIEDADHVSLLFDESHRKMLTDAFDFLYRAALKQKTDKQ